MTEKKKDIRPPRKDVMMLTPDQIIVEEGFNIRNDYGDIDELARSIEENGVKVPVRGFKKDGSYLLTDGHRRIEACIKLQKKGIEIRIPFIVDKSEHSVEQRVVDMLVCNDGKRLTPLEEAEAVNRLINYGLTEKEISTKTGKTGVYISNLKLLQAAPKKVKDLIEADVVSATLAMKILRETSDFLEACDILQNAVSYAEVTGNTNGKVTQKDVDKSQSKVNSVSQCKKLFKKGKDRIVREDKMEIYTFAQKLLIGEYSREDLDELFYEPEEEEVVSKKK